jgi:hypothetical protein
MNRELLEKPFGTDQIKQCEGNFGKTLDYIEGHEVLQRLNDAFDTRWSFEILEHEIQKDTDEVIVLGKLTAGDIVKSQFGSSKITRARETGDMISPADDLKAAGTDALKKCATMLGVGLHLYGKNQASSPGQGGNRNRSTGVNSNFNTDPNGGGNGSGDHNGNSRLFAKQHNYILKLAGEKGITQSALNQKCKTAFGSVAAHLSKNDASEVIKELLAA